MTEAKLRQCIAARLGGCSRKLSREHYISRGVLELLADDDGLVPVSGLPWLKPGGSHRISVASLTAKILCEKHNGALTKIDAAAIELFEVFEEIDAELPKMPAGRETMYVLNGHSIELWVLKVMIGCLGARIGLNSGEARPPILEEWLRRLFERQSGPIGVGLYFVGGVGDVALKNKRIEFAMLGTGPTIIGMLMSIRGFRFLLWLAQPLGDARGTPLDGSTWRPSRIRFNNRDSSASMEIKFTWPDAFTSCTVDLHPNPPILEAPDVGELQAETGTPTADDARVP